MLHVIVLQIKKNMYIVNKKSEDGFRFTLKLRIIEQHFYRVHVVKGNNL